MCMCVYVCVCNCVCMYVCICVFVCLCVFVWEGVFVCLFFCVCTCVESVCERGIECVRVKERGGIVFCRDGRGFRLFMR